VGVYIYKKLLFFKALILVKKQAIASFGGIIASFGGAIASFGGAIASFGGAIASFGGTIHMYF